MAQFDPDYCARLPYTVPERNLTEGAAIAVMALLIHDLEGMEIRGVLPQGSGGDYVVSARGGRTQYQVEVSGINQDDDGREISSRLSKKSNQVLQGISSGFVSVTAFKYNEEADARGVLHFVTAQRRAKKRKKR